MNSEKTRTAEVGRCAGLGNISKLYVIGVIVLLALSTDAMSAGPKCGDEIRVMTLDSLVTQGKLISNENDLLTLYGGREFGELVINQEDIIETYLVRRNTATGAVLGVLLGGGLGAMVAMATVDKSGGLSNISGEITKGVTLVGAGMLFGGIIGGSMGHSSVTLKRFEIEAVPICFTNSGELLPLKLNLSMNF